MRPTHYDGMLEVVGVTGVVHMGQIQSGLRSAMRIAQGGHVSSSHHSLIVVIAARLLLSFTNSMQSTTKWKQ